MTPLSDIAVGSTAHIRRFADDCPETIKSRLASLGFTQDVSVIKLRTAPMGSPSVYQVAGYQMCLRNSEAKHIHCEPSGEPS